MKDINKKSRKENRILTGFPSMDRNLTIAPCPSVPDSQLEMLLKTSSGTTEVSTHHF
jgi:hypothetical protein